MRGRLKACARFPPRDLCTPAVFNGEYDWHNSGWFQSSSLTVTPGDVIFGSTVYDASTDSYVMIIKNLNASKGVKSVRPVKYGEVYTDAYIVTEHQPNSCSGESSRVFARRAAAPPPTAAISCPGNCCATERDSSLRSLIAAFALSAPSAEYPANGGIVFSNIVVAWEGEVSSNPGWTAQTYQPACNSQAQIVDNSTVAFTWDTSASIEGAAAAGTRKQAKQLRGKRAAARAE